MARRKRGKADEGQPAPSKRNKRTAVTRIGTRKSAPEELPVTNDKGMEVTMGTTTSRTTEEDAEFSSDFIISIRSTLYHKLPYTSKIIFSKARDEWDSDPVKTIGTSYESLFERT